MNLSSDKIQFSLQKLQNERHALLRIILDPRPLLIGSVYDVLRRCGNPSCRCAVKPTHRQTLFLTTYRGKRRCRFVRQKHVKGVYLAWERYRKFRRALMKIRAIHRREWKLLLVKMRRRAVVYDRLI